MIEIKQLEYGKIPEGTEEFFLIRQDAENQLILERYIKNAENDWDCIIVHEFRGWTPYNEGDVLKEAKFIVGDKDLYIEEGTFWDED